MYVYTKRGDSSAVTPFGVNLHVFLGDGNPDDYYEGLDGV